MTLLEAFQAAAATWADPTHPPRAAAVAATRLASNAFTEEAMAYAINQAMHRLQDYNPALEQAAAPTTVAVIAEGRVPLDDLTPLLAVVLRGHAYRGLPAKASPHLLPAFVEEVRLHAPALPVVFVTSARALEGAPVLIAPEADAEEGMAGGDGPRTWRPSPRYGVALVDGAESEADWEGLAEDILLHEGRSRRSVALLWAPRDLTPDLLLDALAHFRGVFPAHEGTPGGLKLPQAFLKATNQPHAYGEGLEFLVSRGEAERQQPLHLRWVGYDSPAEVKAWLHAHGDEVEVAVARGGAARRVAGPAPVVRPGKVHRLPFGASRYERELASFLDGLAAG